MASNPCCAQWQKKCSDLVKVRKELREGLKILNNRVSQLELDNHNLIQARDEDRKRASILEEEKANEVSLKASMQKEIAALKAEISSAKPDLTSKNEDLDKEVTLLRACIADKEVDIDFLKQLLADEKARADAEYKTSQLQKKKVGELQEEVAALKSELSSTKPVVAARNEDLDEQATLFRACISEREMEIDHLKHLLDEEKARADAGNNAAELQKVKADELENSLECEKGKADEATKMADAAGKLAEETRIQLEASKNEFREMSLKWEEANKQLEAEKQRCIKEKRCAVEEKARAMEQKRIAEANERRAMNEQCRANNLSILLEEEKLKVEKLQKELQEVMSSERCGVSSQLEELCEKLEADKQRAIESLEGEKLKVEKMQKKLQEVTSSQSSAVSSQLDELSRILEEEKKKVAIEKKRADVEMSMKEVQKKAAETNIKKVMEETRRADKLSQDLHGSKQRIESFEQELNKVNCLLETEKKALAQEKGHVDTLKFKLEEQGRIALENEKRAREEKCRGDNLLEELENGRQRLKDLEDELCEVKQSAGVVGAPSVLPDYFVSEQVARVSLLQEQLKFEKKRVKHFKEVCKLEKSRNSVLQQDLDRLRQEFQSLLQQLDMLSDTFASRIGLNNIAKKPRLLNVQSLELPGRMLGSSPSEMHLCGEAERRMSSLSSRDASCHIKPCTGLTHAAHLMESPSGMENDLEPLVGGSGGEILPSYALNSNTASFSDEQLLGSQEGVVGSLTTSAGLTVEKMNHRSRISSWNDGERVGVIAENGISPVEFDDVGLVKKRRKIIDEFESIKYMHSESKKIYHEAEKKLAALQNAVVQPVVQQMDDENIELPVNNLHLCGDSDLPCKKRQATHEPELPLQQVDNLPVGMDMIKMQSLTPTATKSSEISQLPRVCGRVPVNCSQDDLIRFEQVINGDYMKLLDLDDTVAEENFRMAMGNPLSPTLPDINFHDCGKEVESQTFATPTSASKNAGIANGCFVDSKYQNYCIVFSGVEDIDSVSRIFCATRTYTARLHLFSQTSWLMEDILAALLVEKVLTPREKVCVLFSLILLNFSAVSCSKSWDFQNKELWLSFSAHIQSVLLNVDTRDFFAKICNVNDLLSLSKDFVLRKQILLQSSMTFESPDGGGSSFKILHEAENYVLHPKTASSDLVVAGSIVFASIAAVVGLVGAVCEVSLKIISMCRADYSFALLILHSFACICGEEYFTNRKYCSVMKAVKVLVASAEVSLANNGDMGFQSGDCSSTQFSPCARCPFSGGSVSLEDVSFELLEELQKCRMPLDPSELGYSSNMDSLSCFLGDVLSCLELIASQMGWESVRNKIVPKLSKMLEACDNFNIIWAGLVLFLGDLGRLGVQAGGYNDSGVKSIVQQLSNILCKTVTTKCNTVPMVVHALVRLHPEGGEVLQNYDDLIFKAGQSGAAAVNILRELISSRSGMQRSTCLVS